MSGNKRKRSDDEGQSKYENLQKQKRRRSDGRKATIDPDGEFSATKSEGDSNNNDGVPQADITNLASEGQTFQHRRHDKKRSRKKDPSAALEGNEANTSIQVEGKIDNGLAIPDDKVPNVAPGESEVQAAKSRRRRKRKSRNEDPNSVLEANEASTSIQAEVKMGDGVSIPDGEVAKVTSEEQEIKRQRRKEKRRKVREEREAAKMIQETTKADEEHKHDQDAVSNGAARVLDQMENLQSSDNIKDGAAKASTDANAAKAQNKKEAPKEDNGKMDKMTTAETAPSGAGKAQKKPEKLARSSQKEQINGLIKSKPNRHSRRKSSSRNESRGETAPTWRVSESTGGCMLRIDPLFSPSEDCILIAYDMSVCVFSTSNSLLLRKLRGKKPKQISSLAFSSVDTAQLYISMVTGIIEKWDWVNGTLLGSWDTKTPVHLIATSNPTSANSNTGLVYSLDKPKASKWTITAHRLMAGENASKTDLSTLLKYEEPISSLHIYEEGTIIVATSGQKLLIGSTDNPHQPLLKHISYVWREITCSEWITSVDTRIRIVDASSRKSPMVKAATKYAVDIVVGGIKGAIFVYDDLLASLISKEDKSKDGATDNITPRKLHWHRNAVSSVKWSTDGNYLISGGHETVLAIWQLDTGHRQDLPHLSAAIESVVVSPTGTSYAIRLADNSAMILSTTELQPTFSVAGIQLPAADRAGEIELPSIPTVDFPKGDLLPKQDLRFPAVSATSAGQLLLAVPANSISGTSTRHACFLQTFNVNSAQQVSRQALARNKVTVLNTGPEGNTIEEPNVIHIQLSHDGTWLATVDEWIPPMRDLDHVSFDDRRAKEEQSFRREIYLKFWTWDNNTSSWELVSRIDHPQQTSSGSTGRVLDLVADPLQIGYASVGEDGVVNMWKPQLRKRHGLNVRNKEGKSLTSWGCRWTIHLPSTGPAATSTSRIIRLAFSPDGSVLAAGSSPSSAVHFISTSSGMLHSSVYAQFEGPLFGLGIIDRYLITLSKELRVWDMVTEESHYGVAFNSKQGGLERPLVYTHLAIDHKHNTFAIAVPELAQKSRGRGNGLTSRIAIFDVEFAEPVFNSTQEKPTTSLLPVVGKKGFYCIDTAAEVRTLSAVPKIPEVLVQQSMAQKPLPAPGLGNIYGSQNVLKLTSTNVVAQRAEEEDDTKVVGAEKLAEVFAAGSAFALPAVSEMFEQVAVLFAGI